MLDTARASGITVVHTREGHRPDLSDLSASKQTRGHRELCIGDVGPMGRILVRGERGHDIIEELQPIQGEIVIDEAGNGSRRRPSNAYGDEIRIASPVWGEATYLLRAASADHSAGTPSGIASCGAVLSSELAGARLSPKRKIATIT